MHVLAGADVASSRRTDRLWGPGPRASAPGTGLSLARLCCSPQEPALSRGLQSMAGRAGAGRPMQSGHSLTPRRGLDACTDSGAALQSGARRWFHCRAVTAHTTVLRAAEQRYCSVPGGWQRLGLIRDWYCHQSPLPPTLLCPANPQAQPAATPAGKGVQVNMLPAKPSTTPGLHPGLLRGLVTGSRAGGQGRSQALGTTGTACAEHGLGRTWLLASSCWERSILWEAEGTQGGPWLPRRAWLEPLLEEPGTEDSRCTPVRLQAGRR